MRNTYRSIPTSRCARRSTSSGGVGIGRFIFALMLLIFSSILSAALSPGKRRNYN